MRGTTSPFFQLGLLSFSGITTIGLLKRAILPSSIKVFADFAWHIGIGTDESFVPNIAVST
jgi:hypothetical protein